MKHLYYPGNLVSAIWFAQLGLDRTLPPWWHPIPGLPILHIGPGKKEIDGALELDWPEYDADSHVLPYDDSSIGCIVATHVLEHLQDPRFLLREAGRVLVSGGSFNILVPHAQSTSYLQDLDHKTPFVIDTWKTLLDSTYYDKDKDGFPFNIGANFLFGFTERNLAVVTQLQRKPRDARS